MTWRAARPLLLAAGTALVVGGCLPRAATTQGRAVSGLYDVFVILGIAVALFVWGLLTWAVLRYRKRDDSLPEQVHGSVRLEAFWTAVPFAIVIGLFVLTLITLGTVEGGVPTRGVDAPSPSAAGSAAPGAGGVDAAEPPPGDAVELSVEAFRWGWRFSYPTEGVIVSGAVGVTPEAVVPVGQRLRVTLTAVDVVHAFYVPEFLYKRDAIPGRPSSFELLVETPGAYGGQCAEFCGVFHARMPFVMRAVPAEEYRAWLDQQRAEAQP